MPSTKKSNVSVRLKKKPLTINSGINQWVEFMQEYQWTVDTGCVSTPGNIVASFNSTHTTNVNNDEDAPSSISQEREYELYYKHNLICRDADKNLLRRIGYLIRKNMDK